MQKINVELSIEIPPEYVLISKVELQHLQQNELRGFYWNAKDLERHTGRSMAWLKENVLYPTKFRKTLDVENNGFVAYPQSSGQPWVFQATKMAEFLETNFSKIFGK